MDIYEYDQSNSLHSFDPCPATLVLAELGDYATVIDGQALVVALGKPKVISTFEDLSDLFGSTVLHAGAPFDRTDIAFDRHQQISLKLGKQMMCARAPD